MASTDYAAVDFAGSAFIAKLTNIGFLGVQWILPNDSTVDFIDDGNGIPAAAVASAISKDPNDKSGIESVVAQWSQIAASLRGQLITQSTTVSTTPATATPDVAPVTAPVTTTTYYENDGTATTVTTEVPSAQVTPDPNQDPGVKPVAYFDPFIGEYTVNPNIADYAGNVAVNPSATGSAKGLTGATQIARASATAQDQAQIDRTKDWRVKLSLAPGATYLYNAKPAGILKPLNDTKGVIFPYTPQISVSYASNYDVSDVVHSNYKIYQYKNSSVDNITLTCDFTAQDTYEANYLLAVIHFFRSVTKMFYGKDNDPRNGTPPPLCYLTGLGEYQFNAHPLLISNFTYNLPTDVDYVRADLQPAAVSSVNLFASAAQARLTNIQSGGIPAPVKWSSPVNNTTLPTYVPTKMQITITAHPLVTRNAISNYFSVKDYATGALLQGSNRPAGGFYGGIW